MSSSAGSRNCHSDRKALGFHSFLAWIYVGNHRQDTFLDLKLGLQTSFSAEICDVYSITAINKGHLYKLDISSV